MQPLGYSTHFNFNLKIVKILRRVNRRLWTNWELWDCELNCVIQYDFYIDCSESQWPVTIHKINILRGQEQRRKNKKTKMMFALHWRRSSRPQHLFAYNRFASICIGLVIMWCCSNMSSVQSISIENGAYKDIVIEISEFVPMQNCSDFLHDLEVSVAAFQT